MAINTNVVRVGILDNHGNQARFSISIFGLPTRDVMAIPGGGNYVAASLRRALGEEHEYSSSPFFVTEAHPHSLAPPRFAPIKRPTKRSSLADEFS